MDRPDRVDGSRRYTISYSTFVVRRWDAVHPPVDSERVSKNDDVREISFEQTSR